MKVCDLKAGYLYKDYDKRGWCRNGTFLAKSDNDKVYIKDTYWSDGWIVAKDEYVENFEEVLKLDVYTRTTWSSAKDYNDEDVIQIHYNQCSGRFGIEHMDYFIKKGAKKSKQIKIEQLEQAIKNNLSSLESNRRVLEKLESGEITPEQAYIW